MRLTRAVRWSVASLAAAVALTALVIWWLVARTPGSYRPARLTEPQRQQAVKQFARRIQDFGNTAQLNQPFTWSLSQEELNAYLACLDEIVASMTLDGQAGRVDRALRRAGLTGPAVTVGDGVLTVMIRTEKSDKVLSADLGISFNEAGRMFLALRGARVGSLGVPISLVRSRLRRVGEELPRRGGGRRGQGDGSRPATGEGPSAEDLTAVAAGIADALDGIGIPTVVTWPVKRKRVTFTDIKLKPGRLTLTVRPVAGPSASEPPEPDE